jgi:hypothetical protein
MKSWEQAALIEWLAYHITQEQRAKMMADLPGVYNRMCGREVVAVSVVKDTKVQEIFTEVKPARPSKGAAWE